MTDSGGFERDDDRPGRGRGRARGRGRPGDGEEKAWLPQNFHPGDEDTATEIPNLAPGEDKDFLSPNRPEAGLDVAEFPNLDLGDESGFETITDTADDAGYDWIAKPEAAVSKEPAYRLEAGHIGEFTEWRDPSPREVGEFPNLDVADDAGYDWQRDQPDMSEAGDEQGIIIDWNTTDEGDAGEGELNY